MAKLDEQKSPQIPQRILVLRDFCIRAYGIDCARCAGLCPTDAIALPEAPTAGRPASGATGPASFAPPVINADACIACGICQGACDAFSATGETLSSVHAAARRAALADSGREVVITCRENTADEDPASNVVVVPCLAMLPMELWTQLLCEGTNLSVALDFGRCEECPAGTRGAEGLFTQAIAAAEEASGAQVGFSETLPRKSGEGFFASLAQAGESGEKRDAFSDILEELKDAASGNRRRRSDAHLHDLMEQQERRTSEARLGVRGSTQFNAYAHGGRARKIMHPKRRMLLAAASARRVAGDAIAFTVSTTGPGCDDCLACTKACPTGARGPSAKDGTLFYDPLFCIGCAGCIKVCPTGSITLTALSAKEATCYDGERKPREESCQ